MSEQQQDQVTWQELGAVLDALELQPGWSQATGRAYALVNDVLLWAEVGSVTLTPTLPGANLIASARLSAYMEQQRTEDEAWLATLTDDQRARELDARRAIANLPDPPDWQVLAYQERHGLI